MNAVRTPRFAGAEAGVGTSTLAAALHGRDAGRVPLPATGSWAVPVDVDVLVCRATPADLVRVAEALPGRLPPVLAVVAAGPGSEGALPSWLSTLEQRFAAVVAVPYTDRSEVLADPGSLLGLPPGSRPTGSAPFVAALARLTTALMESGRLTAAQQTPTAPAAAEPRVSVLAPLLAPTHKTAAKPGSTKPPGGVAAADDVSRRRTTPRDDTTVRHGPTGTGSADRRGATDQHRDRPGYPGPPASDDASGRAAPTGRGTSGSGAAPTAGATPGSSPTSGDGSISGSSPTPRSGPAPGTGTAPGSSTPHGTSTAPRPGWPRGGPGPRRVVRRELQVGEPRPGARRGGRRAIDDLDDEQLEEDSVLLAGSG